MSLSGIVPIVKLDMRWLASLCPDDRELDLRAKLRVTKTGHEGEKGKVKDQTIRTIIQSFFFFFCLIDGIHAKGDAGGELRDLCIKT